MIVALILLLVFLACIFLFTARVRRGWSGALRPIAGYTAARQAIARSAECGRPIHLSTGPGGIGDNTTGSAETLAGLNMTSALAQQCAATGAPVLVTTGSGLSFNLAENVVRTAYASVGRRADAPVGGGRGILQIDETPGGVRMLAERDPLAFAVAATALNEDERIMHATTVGAWGQEYLLLGESQRRRQVESVAGAASPQALAVMSVTADYTLLGEEIYAAGAYIHGRPQHIASLLAQDTLRWIVIGLIILGVLLASVGIDMGLLLGIGS